MNFNYNHGNLVFTKAHGFTGIVGVMGDVDSKRKWALLTISSTGLDFARYVNSPCMDLTMGGSLKVVGYDII